MISTVLCLIVTLAIFLRYMWNVFMDKDESIPGPKGLPLFGNVHQLDFSKPHIGLTNLAKHYPDGMYQLDLAGKKVVVVNSWDLLHTIFVKKAKDFTDRPASFRLNYLHDNSLISFHNHDVYAKTMKKAFMGHVRVYGAGFKRVERIVKDVTDKLVVKLRGIDGEEDVDVNDFVEKAVIDMISLLALTKIQSEQRTSLLQTYFRISRKIFTIGGKDELIDIFPFLRFFGFSTWKTMQKLKETTLSVLKDWENQIEGLDGVKEDNSIALDDNFMATVLSFKDTFPVKNCAIVVWEMFAAGITTTTATFAMLINCLVHHPEIQKKLYSEIEEVIQSSEVELKDRQRMPYHQATLLEAGRYISVLPLCLPHQASNDTELAGYKIPKGTMVWPNLWALHHDEHFWVDPYQFRPDRYLTEDGLLVQPDHPARVHTMPFGAGPRVCAGEPFALSRMFIMLATLVKNFEICPAARTEDQSSCDCRNMVTALPLLAPYFKANFKPRE